MRELRLLSLAALRQLETLAEEAGLDLMQRAARATADWVIKHYPAGCRILVAAGPGNNGGDALFAALLLMHEGFSVDVLVPATPSSTATRDALQKIRAEGGIPLIRLADAYPPPALIIDGLFGIGLARQFDDDWAALIHQLNHLGAPILSLDCPSGLDAWTGMPLNAAIHARHTLTFLCHKPGLFFAAGADLAGQVALAALDCPAHLLPQADGLINLTDASALARPRDSHKGRFGTVAVIGGSRGMLGAALLAGRAALAGGAGKVLLLTLDDRLPVDPAWPELMIQTTSQTNALPAADVLAIGPGLGQSEAARQMLMQALDSTLPLVLDADALNLLAAHPSLQAKLNTRQAASILTPHPTEAARLLQQETRAVQSDRLAALNELTRRYHCAVVLKGAGSLIGQAGKHYRLHTGGGPALAVAGQGDVLTGLIAAMLAQGLSAIDAASLAVKIHGMAGDAYEQEQGGPIGLTASETTHRCSGLLNRMLASTP